MKVDDKKAVEWLQKAAKNKTPQALYNMAYHHEIGDILPKDKKKALDYYRQGANLGDVEAMKKVKELTSKD